MLPKIMFSLFHIMTPSELLNLHNRQDLSLTDKMTLANFISHHYYMQEVKKAKQLEQMIAISRDEGGSMPVQILIKYIKLNMGYNYKSDRIIHYALENKCEVYFSEELIAIIDKKNRQVILPVVEKRRAVKERLNRILIKFCGCKLFSKNGEWFIVRPYEEDEKIEGEIVVPGLPDDL